jgi:hypothetical protein
MKRRSSVTRYQKIGAEAIREYLRENTGESLILFYTLSCVADEAAYGAGKKTELFSSLYDYETLLPSGARTQWNNHFLKVVNPFGPSPPAPEKFIPGFFDVAVDMGY